MTRRVVYVALQQFCADDPGPKRLLLDAGFEMRQNDRGRRPSREELQEALRDADAVVAGVEPYPADLLRVLPKLRCISRCGTGTDSIDLEAARQLGIAVYTTPDEVVEPVAQLTVGMMLALARRVPLHMDAIRRGEWTRRMGSLLCEWTIGLIGFGRIGRAVERYLRPFTPCVLVADPRLSASELPEGVALSTLEALLPACDLVSLHASRAASAGPILGRPQLEAMKPGAYLVNTARGHLVDAQALSDAIQSGHLAGAALDVFAEEPYTGPLARWPQVICTPHIASLTRHSRAAMERRSAQSVVEHFAPREAASAGVS